MLKNYLQVAFRNLARQKVTTAINVFGLAVGLACCFLMLLWVDHELDYDGFHTASDRVFRVVQDPSEEKADTVTPGPLGPALLQEHVDVEQVVRIRTDGTHAFGEGPDRSTHRVYWVDPAFFDLFGFSLIAGDPTSALTSPDGLVISQAFAERHFPGQNPIGHQVAHESGKMFRVTGLLDRLPDNSHMQLDVLAPFANIQDDYNLRSWMSNKVKTYVRLKRADAADRFASSLTPFALAHGGRDAVLTVQPIASIHLDSHLLGEFTPPGNWNTIYVFLSAGIFVLAIACLNFVNLTTASIGKRTREAGVRKVLGAQSTHLLFQFWGEACVVATLAFCLAVAVIEVVLPTYNAFVGKELALFSLGPVALAGLLSMALTVGLLSALYPGLVLARTGTTEVLRSRWFGPEARSGRLRSGLVIGQFTISILFAGATVVMWSQMDYLKGRDLGYAKEHLVAVRVPVDAQAELVSVQNTLIRHPSIAAASRVKYPIGWGRGHGGVRVYGEGEDEPLQDLPANTVDDSFVETLGLQVIAGRNFDPSLTSDERDAVLVNRRMVELMPWGSLDDAIGREVWQYDRRKQGRVIGVVEDFHIDGLQYAMRPFVAFRGPKVIYHWFYVRVEEGGGREAIAHLVEVWQDRFGTVPAFSFLDDRVEALYRQEERMSVVFSGFSCLAILIASLGLLGLASFSAERRTKEIGIRKTLGATTAQIARLLYSDFGRLVLIANVIALPLSYILVDRWLQSFAYRVDPSLVTFLFTGLAALLVALSTVTYHAVTAAKADPVVSLRTE
jgi:putative ABC transport system permease protein